LQKRTRNERSAHELNVLPLISLAALWISAALLLSANLVAGQAIQPHFRAILAALALLSAAGGFGLNSLIQRFIYTGYSHAK
jgi:hypothetical protein